MPTDTGTRIPESLVERCAQAEFERVFGDVGAPGFRDLHPMLREELLDTARCILDAAGLAGAASGKVQLQRLLDQVENVCSYVGATLGYPVRSGKRHGEHVEVHHGRASSSVRQLAALEREAKELRALLPGPRSEEEPGREGDERARLVRRLRVLLRGLEIEEERTIDADLMWLLRSSDRQEVVRDVLAILGFDAGAALPAEEVQDA